MHPHCELAVNEILPAVRSLISFYYKKEKNLSQQKIADLLMITQPAVSKYLKQIRAKNTEVLRSDSDVHQKVRDVAEQVYHGKTDPRSFCDICEMVRKKKLICEKCAYIGLCPKLKEDTKVMKYGYQ